MNASPFDVLFSYGQTRERYLLPAGAMPVTCKSLEQLVRPEQLTALSKAIRQDSTLLTHAAANNELQLSPVTRQCLWELHSGIFLRLLENISGHEHLLPDTHHHHAWLLAAHQRLEITDWYDDTLKLPIALYACIGLDTGNALLITASTSHLVVAEPTLGIAYISGAGIST